MPGALSVIIPTFNRAPVIARTLQSVFSQSLPVLEVYLVDDGSTDYTAEEVESFRSENPQWSGRLHFIQQENRGKSAALNRALELTRGDWIAFNDSDDTWHPEKLEHQFRALEEYPDCRACFTNARFSEEWLGKQTEFDGGEINCPGVTGKLENHVWVALTNRSIRMQTIIVQRETMQEVGPFDPELRVAQDVDFVFRLALKTPLCYVNLPLVELDRDPGVGGRLTSDYGLGSAKRDLAHEAMLTKWLGLAEELGDPEIRDRIRENLRSRRSSVANHYLRQGDLCAARRILAKGVKDGGDFRLALKWLASYVAPGLLSKRVEGRAVAES